MSKLAPALAALALSAALVGCGQQTSGADKVKRGEYLVAVASCGDCHTPGALLGKPEMDKALSGSDVGFQIPELGVHYPPNLTSDKETGLGNWSEADVIKAIRSGVRPDGRTLSPIMPYGSYGRLTDDDAQAIVVFLKSLPLIAHKVPGPFGPSEAPTAPYQAIVFPRAASPATPASAPSTPAPQ